MAELSEEKLTCGKAQNDAHTRNTHLVNGFGFVIAIQQWTKKMKVCTDLYLRVKEHCMISLKNGWVEDSGAGPKRRQNLFNPHKII